MSIIVLIFLRQDPAHLQSGGINIVSRDGATKERTYKSRLELLDGL
jgi:hypothetical protein